MPGAHMTVAEDTTLKIGKDGSKSKLLILDGLKQETFERTVSGIWRESTSAVEITSNTVAGSDKAGSITTA